MNKLLIKQIILLPYLDIYLYGGFLRDLLLNQKPSDIDLKIIILSRNKKIARVRFIKFLVQWGHKIMLVKMSLGGLLVRLVDLNLDIMIYGSKKGDVLKTDYYINALHINLKSGSYTVSKQYLNSLLSKQIINSNKSDFQSGQKLLKGLYLYGKLKGFTLSNRFLSFIKTNYRETYDVFQTYATTRDDILKEELEKIIFDAYKRKPNEIKKIWNSYGITNVLTHFLADSEKTQEIYFQDRLDQFHRYAKMLCG